MVLLSFALLFLVVHALAAPTSTTSCSLSSARLSLPPDQSALVEPRVAPFFVAVAIGVQNYTCHAASQTYSNVGALAELFDISCHYGTPGFSSMQDGLYTTWSQAPSSFTAQDLISAAGNNPLVLGQHYHVSKDKCAAGSPALSPKWDFTSNAERGNAAAFIIGAKVGNLPAPTGSNNVDWVQLKNAEGELADTVYRVDTKGGQPPSSCTAGDPPLTVRYTAKYWFFGGSVGP